MERGNNKAAKRGFVYRMIILFTGAELLRQAGLATLELSEKFEIYSEGEEDLEFLPFHKNMKISAFLIKIKIV